MKMSISEACKNRRYKVVEDKPLGSWPSANQITVQDLTDKTYWYAVYRVWDDGADTNDIKEWRKAKKITIETYEPEN